MKQTALILSLSAAFAATSFSADLQAQTTVPAGYLTTTGSGSTSYPFGRPSPIRIQYLYDSSLVKAPVTAIREIAFRANENATVAAKTGVEVEISVSSSPNSIATASTTFAANRGTNEAVVFTKKMVNLPAFTAANPQPFAAVFKLDKSFVYVRTSGNLMIEYVLSNSVTGAYSHDTEFNGAAVITPIGMSCGTPAPTNSVTGGRSTAATSTLSFALANGPASGIAAHVLGFQKLAAPVPLPNGGCSLYIVPQFVFGFATSASGAATATYPIPLGTRSALGPIVYGQWVGITATAWSSSQAQEVKIGGYLPHGRIYDLNGTTNPTGRKQIGSGIIHRIR